MTDKLKMRERDLQLQHHNRGALLQGQPEAVRHLMQQLRAEVIDMPQDADSMRAMHKMWTGCLPCVYVYASLQAAAAPQTVAHY